MEPEEVNPGTIDAEVSCVKCGYSLRGLGAGAVCPECGKAVADSLRPDFLRFADGEWLATIHRGAELAIVGTLLMPVLFFLAVGITASGAGDSGAFLLTLFCFVAATVVAAMGWWRLTTRRPGAVDTVGVYVRLAAVGFLASTGIGLMVVIGEVTGNRLLRGNDGVIVAMVAMMWLSWLVWSSAGMITLRELFDRIPDDLGSALCMSLLLVGFILNTVGVMLVLGPVVTAVLEVILLNRLRTEVRSLRRH